MSQSRLGYTECDGTEAPWAKYFNPEMAPMADHVAEALLVGGVASELLYPIEQAGSMLEADYWPVETGYARTPDLGYHMACLTDMPGVTPAMWDWWFGWHGDDASKYKLWHPNAHVNAEWADGRVGEQAYVGRVSHIIEYLGSELKSGAIGFVSPAILGIDETRMQAQGEIFVCARVGVPETPFKAGWLLHQVRPTTSGSEMRSRMWMGGRYAALGDHPGILPQTLMYLMRPVVARMLPKVHELLVHNAQEMQHLAAFLPALYSEFGHQQWDSECP